MSTKYLIGLTKKNCRFGKKAEQDDNEIMNPTINQSESSVIPVLARCRSGNELNISPTQKAQLNNVQANI